MKKIILAFDGTGNRFGFKNTNVVKLLQAIDHSPGDCDVLTYYEYGIGTFPFQGFLSDVKSTLSNLYMQAVGKGIRRNIQTAYDYLIEVYNPSDQVYLYGFSRGAYTARALAGLLHDYGLLHPGQRNLVKQVSHLYHRGKQSDTNPKGVPRDVRQSFQRLFTRPCKPQLVGVWDTVGSLGVFIKGEKFVNAELNKDVTLGLHAMAIHETRSKFPVSVWSNATHSDGITRQDTGNTIKQLWFAGAHADVGGGYEDTGLSDIALQWMVEESAAGGLPVRADWQKLVWPEFSPNPQAHRHDEFRKLKWRFLGKAVRKLADGSFVHQSALDWAKFHGEDLALPEDVRVVG